MTLWQTIKDWRNPTRTWLLDPSKPLVLDLDSHQLSGVGIGDPVQLLSFLGPATSWSGTLAFPHHGIAVSDSDDSVWELLFYFGHPAEAKGGTYRGVIQHKGIPIEMNANDSEQTITARFGEAYWRDSDEDETILFYEFPAREWQFEFGRDAQLKCLVIAPPILADSVQREAYGVSKPWPPS